MLEFRSDDDSPPRVLIAFYSRGGSVEKLAAAIAEGAESVGAETRMCRTRELGKEAAMAQSPNWLENATRMNAHYPEPTIEDAEWADAIIFGAPTRFGSIPVELKAYVEKLGLLWISGKLQNKIGSAFTSASSAHGGIETTILGLYPAMAHLNLIIVPTGYSHPSSLRAGTPYGAASISYAAEQRPPSEDDLQVARYQGERVARIAHATKVLRHSPEFDT